MTAERPCSSIMTFHACLQSCNFFPLIYRPLSAAEEWFNQLAIYINTGKFF